GAYSVAAKNSCGVATAQIAITVDALPVPVISGNKIICAGDSALITAAGGNTYLWNPTGATTPSIYIRNGGTYTVMVSNSCGTTSSSFNLNVNTITCNFSSGPDTGSAPLPVNFADHSTGTPVSWSWNFGNGSTATGQNPEYIFPSSGTYTVTETVTDSLGCRSSSTTLVVIHDQASWIVVPNIFTPNGDGVNDTWQVSYQNLQDFDVKIFDRWGVELAHLTSPGESWDGHTVAGNMASDGTYYYILTATGGDGKKYTLTGYTMLLHNK
ncbi:MAG TPA: gliding motility-associated C-terminal domain-containing protein, partial [Bacteroidia bacterium]|nr:gliding motility-associated C-terminal domain-containing protein [Bacteroidia bacterium]